MVVSLVKDLAVKRSVEHSGCFHYAKSLLICNAKPRPLVAVGWPGQSEAVPRNCWGIAFGSAHSHPATATRRRVDNPNFRDQWSQLYS